MYENTKNKEFEIMANYHVNLATGQTGVCKAEPGKCPVQATDGAEHFSNKQEAQKRSEEVLTEKSGIMKSAGKVVDNENEKVTEKDIAFIGNFAENENNPIKDPVVQKEILAELKGSGLDKENLSQQELLAVSVSIAHPRILTLNSEEFKPFKGAAKIIFDNSPREKFLENLNEFNNKESQYVMRLDKSPRKVDGKFTIPSRAGAAAVESEIGVKPLNEDFAYDKEDKTENELRLQKETQSIAEKLADSNKN